MQVKVPRLIAGCAAVDGRYRPVNKPVVLSSQHSKLEGQTVHTQQMNLQQSNGCLRVTFAQHALTTACTTAFTSHCFDERLKLSF
jgi:hypothetical protein